MKKKCKVTEEREVKGDMNLTYVLGVLLFATQPSLAGTHYRGAWQDADDDNERYEQNSHMAEKDHYGMNFNISFTSSVGRVMSKKKEKKKKNHS